MTPANEVSTWTTLASVNEGSVTLESIHTGAVREVEAANIFSAEAVEHQEIVLASGDVQAVPRRRKRRSRGIAPHRDEIGRALFVIRLGQEHAGVRRNRDEISRPGPRNAASRERQASRLTVLVEHLRHATACRDRHDLAAWRSKQLHRTAAHDAPIGGERAIGESERMLGRVEAEDDTIGSAGELAGGLEVWSPTLGPQINAHEPAGGIDSVDHCLFAVGTECACNWGQAGGAPHDRGQRVGVEQRRDTAVVWKSQERHLSRQSGGNMSRRCGGAAAARCQQHACTTNCGCLKQITARNITLHGITILLSRTGNKRIQMMELH